MSLVYHLKWFVVLMLFSSGLFFFICWLADEFAR